MPTRVGLPMALALALMLAGPRAEVDERVTAVEVPSNVAAWLAEREAEVPGLRAGDEKAVVWADPVARQRTPVSLVYFHGFSADGHEMDPVPRTVAASLGANLFVTRLAGHGMQSDALGSVTANDWLQDAVEAMAVGRALGERVVLMGMSTGASLALWAASQVGGATDVAGLVLVSPNFQPADRDARLLLLPWGNLLARWVLGPERCFEPLNEEQARHWTTCYPSGALLPLMALAERVRTMDVTGLATPTLVIYSPNDQVVDSREIERVFDALGTESKQLVAFEGSGDPAHHVLAGDIISPETNERMIGLVVDFLRRLVPAGESGPP